MQYLNNDDARVMIEYETRHFTPREFSCPCCGKFYMDNNLVESLDHLRFAFDKPIILTSAYRCEKHNKVVGGSPKSTHLLGQAVDIKIVGMPADDLHYLLRLILGEFASSFGGFGFGHGKLHIDVREKPSAWTY